MRIYWMFCNVCNVDYFVHISTQTNDETLSFPKDASLNFIEQSE
jgi:hypothetical protein